MFASYFNHLSVLQTKCLSSLWILCMSWSPVNRTRKFNFIHKTRKYALDKLIQTKLSEHLLDHNKMIWAKSTYTFLHLTRIELKSRRKWDSYSKNEIRLQLVVWVNDPCFWFAYVGFVLRKPAVKEINIVLHFPLEVKRIIFNVHYGRVEES